MFSAHQFLQVKLTGRKAPWVSAKDVILKILQELSVKGGVNKIVEYTGEGLSDLSLTDRATICNMGAELGATTSVFPTDENTLAYLKQQGREDEYVEMKADDDATYDETIEIDMSTLVPMVAQPHSPDNVVDVKRIRRYEDQSGSHWFLYKLIFTRYDACSKDLKKVVKSG